MEKEREVNFKKGEVLFREGDLQDFAYVIINGSVDICIDSEEGLKKIAVLSESNILGEMSLIDGSPRSATAIACENVECYKITQQHINRIYGPNKSVVRTLFKIQNQRIRDLNSLFK